jgi:hypothetical protein
MAMLHRIGRTLFAVGVASVLGTINGCGPRVSNEELGEIQFEIPKVPGSEQPFPLPSDLPDPAPGEETLPGL